MTGISSTSPTKGRNIVVFSDGTGQASAITALNVLVASGFSIAGLFKPEYVLPAGSVQTQASFIFALYAAARTLPLALMALAAIDQRPPSSVSVCMKRTSAYSSASDRPRRPTLLVFILAVDSGAGQQVVPSPESWGWQRGSTSRVL
jgi:hypothetical protein